MSPSPKSPEFDFNARKVDYTAVRTHQVFIVCGLILAFVAGAWWLAAFVSIISIVGAVMPAMGLTRALYAFVLRPLRLIKPDVRVDNPEPHLFAQGLGGAIMLLAALALLFGATTLGWAICWLVVALASLNLFTGTCVGVLTYYYLHRLGLPGFNHSPLQSRR